MRKRKAKAKGADLGESLTSLSMQAAWATPTATRQSTTATPEEQNARGFGMSLEVQSKLCAWPTPLRSDCEHATETSPDHVQHDNAARRGTVYRPRRLAQP